MPVQSLGTDGNDQLVVIAVCRVVPVADSAGISLYSAHTGTIQGLPPYYGRIVGYHPHGHGTILFKNMCSNALSCLYWTAVRLLYAPERVNRLR